MSVRIMGLGSAEPELKLTNADLEQMVDTSDEWIIQRTGIKERRICQGETMRSLGLKAAKEALADAGVTEVDYILFATVAGDFRTPAQASILAMDLGIDCPAMDINAACTGFLYALDVANALISAGRANRILVAGMELMSRLVDYTDRATCVLFGDGGGAVVLEKGEGLKAIRVGGVGNLKTLNIPGGYGENPWRKAGDPAVIYMDGPEVYKFAVNAMVDEVKAACQAAGIEVQDLDYLIPHQANSRIIKSAGERLKLPPEKVVDAVANRGNTSSGSIPLVLKDLDRAGRLKDGMNIALVAFGGGLTKACAVFQWNKTNQ